MDSTLDAILGVSTAVFMAGNLLGMGLALRVDETFADLRDPRFVGWGLFWSFLVAPALSLILVKVLRIEPSYATGLILVGLAPCAPFMPGVVSRAKGSLSAAASFLLLATIVTLVFVPLAVPWLTLSLPVDAMAIARPLVVFLLTPFVIGLLLHQFVPKLALFLRPIVRITAAIATLLMLVLCVYVFRADILATTGSRSLLALVLLTGLLLAAGWLGSRGLSARKRSVLALGVGTRNLGVPFAVLSSVSDPDPGSIAVIALAIPVTIAGAYLAAAVFAKRTEDRNGEAGR